MAYDLSNLTQILDYVNDLAFSNYREKIAQHLDPGKPLFFFFERSTIPMTNIISNKYSNNLIIDEISGQPGSLYGLQDTCEQEIWSDNFIFKDFKKLVKNGKEICNDLKILYNSNISESVHFVLKNVYYSHDVSELKMAIGRIFIIGAGSDFPPVSKDIDENHFMFCLDNIIQSGKCEPGENWSFKKYFTTSVLSELYSIPCPVCGSSNSSHLKVIQCKHCLSKYR